MRTRFAAEFSKIWPQDIAASLLVFAGHARRNPLGSNPACQVESSCEAEITIGDSLHSPDAA